MGFYVNLQVKVTGKNDENFQSIFRVGVCALHALGRHVVKHGKNLRGNLQLLGGKKESEVRGLYLLGLYPLVGRHVVKHG